MSLTDLYIKDRHSGLIHKIGSNRHDSPSVTDNGTVTYYNLYPKKGTLKSDLMKAEEYTKFLRELFTV